MKKKILSLVLVVAMLTSMLVLAPASGAAEVDGTVAVSDVYGYAGDTVAVDVFLTTEHPVYKYQFAFDYDKSKMTLEDIAFPDGFSFWPIHADAAIDAVMAESPFDNFGWNRATGADPMDASEGAVIATMYFTLNDDALGDAYVSVVPSPINNIAIDNGQVGAKIDNFDYVTGSVTALPAGYIDFDLVDSDGFSFPNDKTVKPGAGPVDTYEGESTGMVLVPETAKNKMNKQKAINGLDTGIFVGTVFTTLIIPAHVETVAEMAIYDPAVEALSIYVMGDTQFAEGAVYLDESTCQVTIYAKEGSAAAEYAVAAGYNYVPYTPYNLTIGETTYVVPGSTVAPGMMEIDGGLAVAWTAGETTYVAGAPMTLTGDTDLEPVTIQKPKTSSALGFKVTDSAATTAMRFTTDMAVADYATLASLGDVTMGTIITPARYVSKAGALTKEALNDLSAANGGKTTYIDIATEGYFAIDEAKTTYTFAGSIKGFKSANVALDYAAAFYLTVETADGATFTVYSDFVFENNRNLTDAAAAVAAAGVGLTDAQKLFLKGLAAAIKNPQA